MLVAFLRCDKSSNLQRRLTVMLLVSSQCPFPPLFVFPSSKDLLCRHSCPALAAMWNKSLIGWCPAVVPPLSLNQSPMQLRSSSLLLSSPPLCSFLLRPVRPVGLVFLIVGSREMNFLLCYNSAVSRNGNAHFSHEYRTAADFDKYISSSSLFVFKETLWWIPSLEHQSCQMDQVGNDWDIWSQKRAFI